MSGTGPTGEDERVEAGVAAFMDARRRLWMPADLVRAILAAADAVAAQDPAPRAEPNAWLYTDALGRQRATVERHEAEAMRDMGSTIDALYRDPAPAPVAEPTATRGLLRSAWRESTDWRTQAERLARLLARDRVALARVKTQRDDKRQQVRDLAADLGVNLSVLLAPVVAPDEADQATADEVARHLRIVVAQAEWSAHPDRGVPRPAGAYAHHVKALTDAGWRLVPPTGGAS